MHSKRDFVPATAFSFFALFLPNELLAFSYPSYFCIHWLVY